MASSSFLSYSEFSAPMAAPDHITAALKQEVMDRLQPAKKAARYSIDVPISSADVDRWGLSFSTAIQKTEFEESKRNEASSLQDKAPLSHCEWNAVPFYLPGEVLALRTKMERVAAIHPFAPLPVFVPGVAGERSMTKILQHRRKWMSYRQQIPIHRKRMELVDTLCKNVLVSVVGSAGSGRSLQLPQILAESEALKKSRILLVASNESAARLLVLRLKEEQGEAEVQGDTAKIGLSLPLEASVSRYNSIVVLTADVLVRQLLCDPTLIGVGAVIFDDIHLRTEVTEVCLFLLRDLLITQAEARSLSGVPQSSSLILSLHVIVNCGDVEVAKQIKDFFSQVASTIFTLPSASLVSEGISNEYQSTNPVVFYVDETVQWLHKCATEKSSVLCKDPVAELSPYAAKVEVVTRTMAGSEADFFDENKCRQYWCKMMTETIMHFDRGDKALRASRGKEELHNSVSLILVVIPNLDYAVRVIKDELQLFVTANEPKKANSTLFTLHNLMDYTNENVNTWFTEFLPHLLGTETFLETGAIKPRKLERTILLGSGEIMETLLPPGVQIGLYIDFARVSSFIFDTETSSDYWTTDYASFAQLRLRRRIIEKNRMVSSPAPPPLIVQLVPKSLLHSSQSRRTTSDSGHHAVFRLSSARYIQLFQLLQLREDTIHSARARRDGFESPYAFPAQAVAHSEEHLNEVNSTSDRIVALIAQYFIGAPPPTSNKYETIRRVFKKLDTFLRAAGHLVPTKTVSSGVSVTPQLQPLGVLSTVLPLPVATTRLLAFGVLLQSPLEATAAAAILLGGDPFIANLKDKSPKDKASIQAFQEAWDVRKALGRDGNDVLALFNLYKLWLQQRGKEDEEEFFAVCHVDRKTLEKTLSLHAQLWRLLETLGMVKSAEAKKSDKALQDYVANGITQLPENSFAEEAVQVIVSGAMYPQYGIPEGGHGAVALFDSVVPSGVTPSEVGVFSATSLMHESDTLQQVDSTPVSYWSRALIDRHCVSPAGAASTPVLHQAVALHPVASIVFCGEEKEQRCEVPRRCRGWSSILTNAWRRTRRARVLTSAGVEIDSPPPIPFQPFDVLESKLVIVAADRYLQYVMRSSTADWLLQLRKQIQKSLVNLVQLPRRNYQHSSGTEVSNRVFSSLCREVASAWAWWCRRKANGVEWLREERVKYAMRQQSDISENGENAEAGYQHLYPYYVFQTAPGIPAAVAAPVENRASTEAYAANEEPEVEAFTGKRPNPEMVDLIQQCVIKMKEENSWKDASTLLQTNPEVFSFLDPQSEYYEYYCYEVKRLAPQMEKLGDNEESLLEFLEELEKEVRSEFQEISFPEEVPQPELKEIQVEDIQDEFDYQNLVDQTPAYVLKPTARPKRTAPASEPPPSSLEVVVTESMGDLNMEEQGEDDDPTAVQSRLQGGVATEAPPKGETLGLGEQPAFPRPPNPLSHPPPPLPASVVEQQSPSVLAFPLPTFDLEALTTALRKALAMKSLGPAIQIGKVARISLPNENVERRCIEMGSFRCGGKTVNIFKNDRIIDNPNLLERATEPPGLSMGPMGYGFGNPMQQCDPMGAPPGFPVGVPPGMHPSEAVFFTQPMMPPSMYPEQGGYGYDPYFNAPPPFQPYSQEEQPPLELQGNSRDDYLKLTFSDNDGLDDSVSSSEESGDYALS